MGPIVSTGNLAIISDYSQQGARSFNLRYRALPADGASNASPGGPGNELIPRGPETNGIGERNRTSGTNSPIVNQALPATNANGLPSLDACSDHSPNCAENVAACTYYKKAMKKYCPKTCGLCDEKPDDDSGTDDGSIDNSRSAPPSSEACVDSTDDCNDPRVKSLCNLPLYERSIRVNCPVACGVCTPTGANGNVGSGGNGSGNGGREGNATILRECADLSSRCKRVENLCNNQPFRIGIRRLCPLTCRLCAPGG